MDDNLEAGGAVENPSWALVSLKDTVPLTRSDDIGEGDVMVFPTADRVFRVGHVLEDGSYGGDVCLAANLDCLLSWEWYTLDEMIEMGNRAELTSSW